MIIIIKKKLIILLIIILFINSKEFNKRLINCFVKIVKSSLDKI